MANKTLMDKINQGRQYRAMQLEIDTRSAEEDTEKKYIVKGYATTFDEPYTLYSGDGWELREKVSPDAFNNCDMSDVIFQYDHEGRVYARLSNGTMHLECDEHGLLVTADLGGTEEGRKLYEEIKGGYTNKMSFGFTIGEDEETRSVENGNDVYLRNIKSISRLFDVSAVSIPANSGTEISARCFVDGVIAKRTQEMSEKEKLEEEHQRQLEEEQRQKEENDKRARWLFAHRN